MPRLESSVNQRLLKLHKYELIVNFCLQDERWRVQQSTTSTFEHAIACAAISAGKLGSNQLAKSWLDQPHRAACGFGRRRDC
jgi:hypothetical protein